MRIENIELLISERKNTIRTASAGVSLGNRRERIIKIDEQCNRPDARRSRQDPSETRGPCDKRRLTLRANRYENGAHCKSQSGCEYNENPVQTRRECAQRHGHR